MKLVCIFGPQASGKMTVGQQLAKITDLKLFHNHMTIELVANFFNYSSSEGKRLVNLFRQEIFEAVAKSDLEGLIFTYVWAFNEQTDWERVNNLKKLFKDNNGEVYFIELECAFDERLKRNEHPHRLKHKPSKRNLDFSKNDIVRSMQKYRLNSNVNEIDFENYIKINNTNISAIQVAQKIKKHFNL